MNLEQLLIGLVDGLALSLRNQGLVEKARNLEALFDAYVMADQPSLLEIEGVPV